MEHFLGTAITVIMSVFSVFIFCSVCFRGVKNSVSPVREIRATITEKQKYTHQTLSFHGVRNQEKYVITFLGEGKKLLFEVSAFSYDGYQIQQTGTLTYKGSKLISFED